MEVLRANIKEREKLLGLYHGFFVFFGGWGLRLWLVVVAMVVAMAVGGGGSGC